MPRPLLATVGWVAATAAAVAVAHAGVSAVAGRVVEPLPPAVGLADSTDPAAPTTASSTSPDPAPTGTEDPTEIAPSATLPSPPADTTGPSTPAAPSSPDPAPTAEVRSYALVGGTATLRYAPGRVTVLAAEPAQGFSLEVDGDGTAQVTVEFEGDTHRSRLRGEWDDGPEDRVDEDERSGGGDADDDEDD